MGSVCLESYRTEFHFYLFCLVASEALSKLLNLFNLSGKMRTLNDKTCKAVRTAPGSW